MSMSSVSGQRIEELAQDFFGLMTQLSLSTQSLQRRRVELKEFEFLTLCVLNTHPRMIVGEIQRLLGVLPAQMSRIIRSLESRQPPFIECQINPNDKRKIDVRLTPAGERALFDYQELRVQKLTNLFQNLSEEDQEDLSCWIQKISDLLKGTKREENQSLLIKDSF